MNDSTHNRQAGFFPGQLVRHRRFGYRGVVYDVDPVFDKSDAWYEAMADTRPPKDRPWYRVLVDGQPVTTYVAERNLEPDDSSTPIRHPLVEAFFTGFDAGVYQLRVSTN
ncbi:MAG TPA: heat shock protein HspQ [Thioalkalivibrio sp.]|nr:heat shock protein HspQ [Thioalkalivibrio sp.]